MQPQVIKTQRLILRPWQEEDLEPFAKLNADPRVMEYFPATLNRQESDQLAKRMSMKIEEQGWGFWAVSVPGVAEFIGLIGIAQVNFTSHFTPAVEIGWRLAYDFWGQGYALEGAQASLQFGFKTLQLDEIVSFTTVANQRSRRVMEKLGMLRDPKEDFEHPRLKENDPLRLHVLYRIKRQEWSLPSTLKV
jgi:3-dehydroquinate dehydratase / shikimate dehydrogenase